MTDIDPIGVALAALQACPGSPSDATPADLVAIEAVAQGIARHTADLLGRVADLADRVVADPESMSLRAALECSEALDREYTRALVVERALKTYLRATSFSVGAGGAVVADERMLDPLDLVGALIESTPATSNPGRLGESDLARIDATAHGLFRYATQARDELAQVLTDLAAGRLDAEQAHAETTRLGSVIDRTHTAIDLLQSVCGTAGPASETDHHQPRIPEDQPCP